jgi:hypothetical protein
MNKCTPVTALLLCACMVLQAQGPGSTYRTALGLKLLPTGITMKHFIGHRSALEGITYINSDQFRVIVLYEFHGAFGQVDGLHWYVGPGLHAGFRTDHWEERHPGDERKGENIGADGVIGLDYKIGKLPLNLSLDWQPALNLAGNQYFEARQGGLGVRFTF